MPIRVSPRVWQRAYATVSPPLSSIPTRHLAASSSNVPKLGKIGRWYLPTMALVAVGMIYLPNNLFSTAPAPSPRTVTLDSANRKIGFAIANALEEHNIRKRKELSQMEKNRLLMDAYGSRSTLEDIEHAFQQMEKTASMDHHDRLQEAYGERTSLRDMQRAMEVYEVQ